MDVSAKQQRTLLGWKYCVQLREVLLEVGVAGRFVGRSFWQAIAEDSGEQIAAILFADY